MSAVLLDLREYDRCERAYAFVPPDPFVVAEARMQLLKREHELRPTTAKRDRGYFTCTLSLPRQLKK